MQLAHHMSTKHYHASSHGSSPVQHRKQTRLQNFMRRYGVDDAMMAHKIYASWKSELQYAKKNFIGITTNFSRTSNINSALSLKNEKSHLHSKMRMQNSGEDSYAITLSLTKAIIAARNNSVYGATVRAPIFIDHENLVFRFDLRPSLAKRISHEFMTQFLTAHALHNIIQSRRKM